MSKLFSSNEKTFKELMSELVKAPGIRRQYLKVVMKTTWEEEMGPLVVKYTKRLTINKGTLTVCVSSAPLRQELMFNKVKIIEMMNKAFGEELVKEVVIA